MKRKLLCYILPILLFTVLLLSLSTYVVLDAFVLDRPLEGTTVDRRPIRPMPVTSEDDPTATDKTPVTGDDPTTSDGAGSTEVPPVVDYPIIGDRYYEDENVRISIEETYYMNRYGVENKCFIVDLKLSSIEYLQTYVNEMYGEIERTTVSNMAEMHDAIFAINGDFFTMRKKGFVIRNYTVWRDSARSSNDPFSDDALLLLSDGSFVMVDESEIYYNGRPSALGLPLDTYQCFSFGPRLLEYGEITVDENDEVGQSAASNPRTAIGMIEPLHYKIVVAEGRLDRYDERDGLTLYELADLMQSIGCENAYNLDGGSSSTLYFNGEVLNETPSSERKVSDCIFINGYRYDE